MSRNPYQILIKPVLTEKATDGQVRTRPQFTFKVAIDSNKIEIRRAVEKAFGVHVMSVNTILNQGKRKRLRTAKLGRRSDWKKAIVTLKPGESINLV